MSHSHHFPHFPPLLKKGGTIGIVSPARWPEPAWIDKTVHLLADHGYQTVVHSQNYLHDGRLAGKDKARAEAIMDMFLDPTIDAIMCARGGTGTMRMLDLLDYKIIKKNPKPFIGFSDITTLLNIIAQRCGFVTFHGPMGWNLAHPHDPRVVTDLLAMISDSDEESITLDVPSAEVTRAGRAEGLLVGGNLSLLQHMLSTPYDWSARDAILFIEDVEEPPYKIDRMLRHLALAGKFEHVRAVIVGEMVGVVDDEVPYGRTVEEMVMEVVPPHVPVCLNFPCGHGDYITTLPVGAHAHIEMSARGVALSIRREIG